MPVKPPGRREPRPIDQPRTLPLAEPAAGLNARPAVSEFRPAVWSGPGTGPKATASSYFPSADNATAQDGQRVFAKLEQLFGALPLPARPPAALTAADRPLLERLAKALDGFAALPDTERKSALQAVLLAEWLGRGVSLYQLVNRLELAIETGYALCDRGPLLANPYDELGWNDQDLARVKELLSALPPSLKELPHLHYITRDARSEAEDRILEDLKADLATANPKDLPQKLLNAGLSALLRGIDSLNMGGAFGEAWYSGEEVRLFGELFAGSRIPGLENMLAYTTIHELGHHQLHNDASLRERWTRFYQETGRAEAPNGYARGSLDEGYGVCLGMYAVAPELLRKRSPQTFEFFRKEFGDTLNSFRGRGLEGAAIELVYGLQDAVVKLTEKSR